MELLITKCSDSFYWYRSSIGSKREVRSIDSDGTAIVRDNDGYTNIVELGDYVLLNDTPRIVIKQCSTPGLWYNDNIGEIFTLTEFETDKAWWVKHHKNKNAWVYKEDAEVIADEV